MVAGPTREMKGVWEAVEGAKVASGEEWKRNGRGVKGPQGAVCMKWF